MASKSIFPDEIMTEILLKLPVKSILRCTTLSKHYYSLIHTKFFIHRHLALGRLNNQFFVTPLRSPVRLFDRRCHVEVLEPPPPVDFCGLEVCGPVEGLYSVIDTENERFIIWNPSTKEQFRLPPTPGTGENSCQLDAAKQICYRACFAYGFGYDKIMDDYKFVIIYYFLDAVILGLENVVPINARRFNVFSVRKGEWSTKEWSGVEPWDFGSGVGVFSHGACHWVYSSSRDSPNILAFDMLIESHRFIAFPIVGDKYVWSDSRVVKFNGCLGLVNSRKGVNRIRPYYDTSFDVWVMSEYGVTKSWTILFQLKLPESNAGLFTGIVSDRIYFGKADRRLYSYGLFSKDEERYAISKTRACTIIPFEESLVRIIKSVE